MKFKSSLTCLILGIGLASASCSGGDDDTQAPPASFSGDSFVLDAVQHTSETAEPASINGQELTFSEDPHAFDAAFQ